MNEIELKLKAAEALTAADTYQVVTVGFGIGGIILAIISVVLLICWYENFDRSSDVGTPIYKAHTRNLVIAIVLSLAAFLTAFLVPSKDSKLAEAQAYMSSLPVSPTNAVYVQTISERYKMTLPKPVQESPEVVEQVTVEEQKAISRPQQ